MLCPSCSKEIPDGSVFCNLCGKSTQLQSANKSNKPYVMFLVGLAVAGAIALAVYLYKDSQRASETQNTTGAATAQAVPAAPQPQPHSVSVVNNAFTVDAGLYASYRFEVPANAKSVVFNGHFTATGGSKDIRVFLLNEDEFVNMQNGHDARMLYDSGKVTQATIAVPLPETPMTYHLVFDNRFSLLTPKAVQVHATLDYLQ